MICVTVTYDDMYLWAFLLAFFWYFASDPKNTFLLCSFPKKMYLCIFIFDDEGKQSK